MNNDTTPRPPISAALLAQAESIEAGMCFGRQGDELIVVGDVPEMAEWWIVTWRGMDNEESNDNH